MRPVLFLNFKTYREATGKRAVALARLAQNASKKANKKVVLVVQAADIHAVAGSVSLEVFAQHIDPVGYGPNTGKILPEAIKSAGAAGAIANHAEDRQDDRFVEGCVKRAREAGLKIMVCAGDARHAAALARFRPDFIAIEPPELIGGTNSVSRAKPGLISSAVAAVKAVADVPVIAGAGISRGEDVKRSIELGAGGVFVASAVVKAANPRQKLMDLLSGLD